MSPQPIEHTTPLKPLQPLQQAWRRWRSKALGKPTLHTLYWSPEGVLSWPFAALEHGGKPSARNLLKATACGNFDVWCAAHANSEVRIFVSGHLLHSLVVDPALKLTDDAAVHAYALQQFGHYHGAAAKQWPLAVWLHQSKTQFQSGACALHGVDMAALHNAARGHGVRVRSVSPVWSAGLSSVTSKWSASALNKSVHAVALIEGHLLTWMVLQSGRVLALEQRYLDAPDWPAAQGLVAQLSADSAPLAAPPALVAWGLPALANAPEHTSNKAAVRTLHENEDDCRTISAWVFDAMGPSSMAA